MKFKRLGKKGKTILFFSIFVIATLVTGIFLFRDNIEFDTRSRADSKYNTPEFNNVLQKGDLTGDGTVGVSDFGAWLGAYRTYRDGEGELSEEIKFADLAKDGKVSLQDFRIWLESWRKYKEYTDSKDPMVVRTIRKTSEGFNLVAYYKGNNLWEYTVSGNFPDGCHSGKVAVEQSPNSQDIAVFNLNISQSTDSACTQALVEFKDNGRFTASELAKVEFNVSGKTKTIVRRNVEGFRMVATYKGNNSWDYVVTGEFPDEGCTKGRVEVSGVDSARAVSSRVSLTLRITHSGADACLPRITPFRDTGTFKGAENVGINFTVSRDNRAQRIVKRASGGFNLVATYKGNNSWEYSIRGKLPTACHKAEVKVIERGAASSSSTTSSATLINVTIIPPLPDQVCAQATKPFEKVGRFKGNEKIDIVFRTSRLSPPTINSDPNSSEPQVVKDYSKE